MAGSMMGSVGGGSSLAGNGGAGGAQGHARSLSFGRDRDGSRTRDGRGSFGQKQMREMMMDSQGGATAAAEGSALSTSPTPPVPSIPEHLANGGERGASPVGDRKAQAGPSEEEKKRERGSASPSAGGGGHRRSGEFSASLDLGRTSADV